jgi:hypothetical protein
MADMMILHSPVEMQILSFSFLLLLLDLLTCTWVAALSAGSLSSADSVMMTHSWCILPETPPLRVMISFWLGDD